MKLVAMAVAVLSAATALVLAPPASAKMFFGNYNLVIPDRRDFHTWILVATAPCRDENATPIPGCISAQMIPQPVAKASYSNINATLADGRYTMVIDNPFGLRCGNIYYGPVVPTHDVYSWDENTLTGEMTSTFDAGCDGAPGGTLVYPFALLRL